MPNKQGASRLSLWTCEQVQTIIDMTKRSLFGSAAVAALVLAGAWSLMPATMRYQPRNEHGQGQGYRGAYEYLAMMRGNAATGRIEPGDRLAMEQAVDQYVTLQGKSLGMDWIEMGPDNVGGRVRAIVIDVNNPQVIWTGGVSGGVFRSTDNCNTWTRLSAFSENLCVSSMAQLPNGDLFVATGSTFEGIGGTGGSGFIGGGLFKTSDNGATWETVFAPTTPWSTSTPWAIIDEIVADPTDPNKLWIAYNGGLRKYNNATGTLETVPQVPTTSCRALAVSADGLTALANFGLQTWITRDGGSTWTQLTLNGNGIPVSQIGRAEYAISPDDPNYMYALFADGSGRMRGVWASTNNGFNWFQIWPAGFGTNGVPELDIFGDNSQGIYDNEITVVPGQPDRIWVGGVSLWTTSINAQPTQLALAFDFPGCFTCVHADVHAIVFGPDGTAYVGCDGGIYVSPPTAGQFFYAANRFLNITQFYSMAYSPEGKVMGGTQDNGTQYIRLQGNTLEEAIEVTGGDGFDCEISQVDPNIMFSTIYTGALFRSSDGGNNFGPFYDSRVLAMGNPGALSGGLGDFYTNIRLYENWNDTGSQDSITWTNNTGADIPFGTVIEYRGRISAVPQFYTVTQSSLPEGASIRLQDKAQSLFAVGFFGTQGVWVTRDATQFVENPEWWKVANNAGGNVNVLEWSHDGDKLFWGTREGKVFMVEGFNNAYSLNQADVVLGNDLQISAPQEIYSGSTPISGLSADPNNADRLLVTRAQYGSNQKVLILNRNGQNWSAQNVWNVPSGLLGMPVYDGMIHAEDPNIFIIGTEFGVMATDDGGQTWDFENSVMGKVPVFSVRQQRETWNSLPFGAGFVANQGVVYAGSHGRGIFRSEKYLSVPPVGTGVQAAANGSLRVFPNPANVTTTLAFTLEKREDVQVSIYDIHGRLVRSERPSNLGASSHQMVVDVEDLPVGTYVAEAMVGKRRHTARLVITR